MNKSRQRDQGEKRRVGWDWGTKAEKLSWAVIGLLWTLTTIGQVRGAALLPKEALTSNAILLSGCLVIIAIFSTSIARSAVGKTSRVQFSAHTVILTAVSIAILVTLKTGGIYDYVAYKAHWQAIMEGGTTWLTSYKGGSNTYGPVYNLMAWAYRYWDMLPKLLSSITCVFLLWLFIREERNLSGAKDIGLATLVGPMVVSGVFVYGFIDGLTAATTWIAVYFAQKGRLRIAGWALAVATAIKFYPLIVAPSLIAGAIRSSKPRSAVSRLVLGFLSGSAAISGIAIAMWGDLGLRNILIATNRFPSFLTAWRFAPQFATQYSTIIAIAYFTVVCLLSFRMVKSGKLGIAHSCIAGLCSVFGMYYLGHQQFYIVIIMLISLGVLESRREVKGVPYSKHKKEPSTLLMMLAGWLTFIQVSFDILGEFRTPGADGMLLDFLSVANSFVLSISALGIVFWARLLPTRA